MKKVHLLVFAMLLVLGCAEEADKQAEKRDADEDKEAGLCAKLAYALAVMDAGKALPESHPDVALFESLINRLSGRFEDSRQQIFNLTVWTRNNLKEKGISEKLANIMEGVLEAAESLPLVNPVTQNQWYINILYEYKKRRKEGLSHEEAVRKLASELDSLWKQGPPARTEGR